MKNQNKEEVIDRADTSLVILLVVSLSILIMMFMPPKNIDMSIDSIDRPLENIDRPNNRYTFGKAIIDIENFIKKEKQNGSNK